MPCGHIQIRFTIWEGFMRSNLCLIISSSIFLLLSIGGCHSTPAPQTMQTAQSTTNKHSARLIQGEFDNIHIPPYIEYEPISLIFTTTEEYDNIDSPYMTYLSLLRKAHEIGGHAIVNVSIEENKSCVKTERSVGPYEKGETVCKYMRFGAALAVKYTKPIKDISTLHAPTALPTPPAPQPEKASIIQTEEHSQSNTGLLGKIF